MTPNPPSQYADDRNLGARQRLWATQRPYFDLAAWVLDLAAVAPGHVVLDVGCGNGVYLRAMRDRGVSAFGFDLSFGMLESARPHALLANVDVMAIVAPADAFDVVLAPHMLYHVPDRERAGARCGESCARAACAWRSPTARSTPGRCATSWSMLRVS